VDGSIRDVPVGQAFEQVVVSQRREPREASSRTCAIRASDRIAQCWGGAGPRNDIPTDVPLARLGKLLSCGIKADTHEVVCTSAGVSTVPAAVSGMPMLDVTGTYDFSCAIRETDHLMTCWGGLLWNPL
jgi:hypothetical protein